MTDREAMKMSLPLLEAYQDYTGDFRIANKCGEVIKAIRTALAQPEQSKYSDIVSDGGLDPRNKFDAQQEPVAVIGNWGRVEWADGVFPQLGDKMYAAPPKREWVGLTDEERVQAFVGAGLELAYLDYDVDMKISKVIESRLKEKNT